MNQPYTKHRRWAFFFKKTTIPYVISELIIDGVISYEVSDRSQIGTFMFSRTFLKDEKITIKFIEDMDIYVAINAKMFNIELKDIQIMEKGCSFFSIFREAKS